VLAWSERPEYLAWTNLKQRCFNANNPGYKHYGGRGIAIHPLWAASFLAFFEHIGPRPSGLSLDRIDNEQGYFPGNVRWTDVETQINNRRPRRVREKPERHTVHKKLGRPLKADKLSNAAKQKAYRDRKRALWIRDAKKELG
jgi:hypothetical protein